MDEFAKSEEAQCLAYFYCSRTEPGRSRSEHVFRSIVKQMSRSDSDTTKLPDSVIAIYEKREKDHFAKGPLQVAESIELIINLASRFSATTIVIDALDECETNTRDELLCGLNTIIERVASLIKIFVSSRIEPDITAYLQDLPHVYVDKSRNGLDINAYVRHEVEKASAGKRLLFGRASTELKQEVIERLMEGAQGM